MLGLISMRKDCCCPRESGICTGSDSLCVDVNTLTGGSLMPISGALVEILDGDQTAISGLSGETGGDGTICFATGILRQGDFWVAVSQECYQPYLQERILPCESFHATVAVSLLADEDECVFLDLCSACSGFPPIPKTKSVSDLFYNVSASLVYDPDPPGIGRAGWFSECIDVDPDIDGTKRVAYGWRPDVCVNNGIDRANGFSDFSGCTFQNIGPILGNGFCSGCGGCPGSPMTYTDNNGNIILTFS